MTASTTDECRGLAFAGTGRVVIVILSNSTFRPRRGERREFLRRDRLLRGDGSHLKPARGWTIFRARVVEIPAARSFREGNPTRGRTMSTAIPLPVAAAPPRALADRIFRIAIAVNLALTAFALLAIFTGFGVGIAGKFEFDGQSAARILISLIFFNGIWALIWYGVKNLLLAKFVRMSREDRRAVFSSRMSQAVRSRGIAVAVFRTPHPHRRHDRPARPLHHARDGAPLLSSTPTSPRTAPATSRVRSPARRCSKA